ncbi:MAG: InlB B-repeat-containing protein [Kiritimatiellae bacterium]|nr:InlB B-repeat-containing protein [Kiritimatiellia bacterium]
MNPKPSMKRISVLLLCLLPAFASYARNPIVFLHGYNSDGEIWSEMKTLLGSDVGYASNALQAYFYYNNYFGYSKSTPIEQVALGVAKEITELAQNTGQPVDLVCHSMGGLIVRAMLAYDLIDRRCIGKFVALATPHYGQNMNVDKQSGQMKYGSKFLWDLADAWHFQGKTIEQTLCIAGIGGKTSGSYWDGLVHCWSAALGDGTPCRYVKAVHSSSQASWLVQVAQNLDGDAIYRCPNTSTPVYRLVKEFLANGNVLPQYTSFGVSDSAYSTILSQGGLFFQIVNTSGYAVSYPSSTSALVPTYVHIGQNRQITAESLEHGASDTESQTYGIEMVYGTLPAGNYRLLTKATGYIPSFLVQPVPVVGGRMTVCRLRSDGQLLKNTVTARLETGGGTLPSPYSNGQLTSLVGYPYGTLPTPSKPDHQFGGWYTTPDYNGFVGPTTLASAQNTTLYAKLTPLSCTVTFNANGGTTEAADRSRLYEEAIGELPEAKRTGYTFLGWFTAANGGVPLTSDTRVTANLTCYAHWQINIYTVSFDTSGGIDPAPIRREYNSAIGTLPRPEREGFRFRGWFTAPEGGTRIRSTTKVLDDTTVYAHWSAGGSTAYTLYPNPIYGNLPAAYKGGTYKGYAVDESGNITGTLVLAVKKPKKGTSNAAATLTFTSLATGKRAKLTGTVNLQTGTGSGALSGLLVGTEAIGGNLAKFGEIDGGLDAVKAKRSDLLTSLAKFNRHSYGIVLETLSANGNGSAFANGFSTLSIAFSTKGKAKVTGVLADGVKVSLSVQLIVGEETCCLPVLYSKKSRFGFVAWFDRQTRELLDLTAISEWKKTVKPSFEAGWDIFEIGSAGHLANGTKTVFLDPDTLQRLVPSAIAQTPSEVALNVTGKTAWNAGKAAKVAYKGGNISINGANVSGLKLSFLPKTGLFKGTFTVYSVSKGKLTRNKFSANGIVIDGVGYGNAVLKNKGSSSLMIENEN